MNFNHIRHFFVPYFLISEEKICRMFVTDTRFWTLRICAILFFIFYQVRGGAGGLLRDGQAADPGGGLLREHHDQAEARTRLFVRVVLILF